MVRDGQSLCASLSRNVFGPIWNPQFRPAGFVESVRPGLKSVSVKILFLFKKKIKEK